MLQRKPSYGYELTTTIDEEFDVYISPGSTYPILYDLERAGLILGAWDQPDRRSKKVDALTAEGERALKDGFDTLGRVLSSLRRTGDASRSGLRKIRQGAGDKMLAATLRKARPKS